MEGLRVDLGDISGRVRRFGQDVVKNLNQPIKARGIGKPINFAKPVVDTYQQARQGFQQAQRNTVQPLLKVGEFATGNPQFRTSPIGQLIQGRPVEAFKAVVPTLQTAQRRVQNVFKVDPKTRRLVNPQLATDYVFQGVVNTIGPTGTVKTRVRKELEPAVSLLRNRLAKEDVMLLGRFGEMVEKAGSQANRKNMGIVGQQVQTFLEAAFGRKAANWTNREANDAINYVLRRIAEGGRNKAGLGLSMADVSENFSKERGFITSVKQTLPREQAKNIEGFYTPYSDEASLMNANRTIESLGLENAKKQVLEGTFDKSNVALGEVLANKALSEGRFDEFKEIVENLSVKGTTGGQAVQAFSMWSRLSPAGMLRYANETIRKAQAETSTVNKVLGRQAKNLTDEETKTINDLMTKANQTTDPAEQQKYAKLALQVVNEKVPLGVSEMFEAFRLNNILSNPRSHLRNIWGNALNTFVVRPGQLAFEGRPIEAAKYEIGALKNIPNAIDDAVESLKGNITDLQKLDIQQLRNKKLPLVLSASLRALGAEDKFFSRIIQGGELARGKSAQEAAKYADDLLYRAKIGDKEAQGYVLRAMDNTVGKLLEFASKIPVVNWFVPFARTPFNIAKMSYEMSPLGFSTVFGAADKRGQIAKATIGSIASLVGAQLAMEGRTTFAPPTDPDAKELFYASGKRPFSVQIGDKWVPVATFGPLGLALMLPAMLKYYNEDSPTALTASDQDKLAQTLMGTLYFWSQQTPLEGVGSFVDLARGNTDMNFIRNLGFTASQGIPYTGLLNYVAQVLDPIYRKPAGFFEQVMQGIPEVSKQVEGYYTNPDFSPATRPPSAFVAPYTLGTDEPKYETPLAAREAKLRENKLFSKELSKFDEVESQIKTLVEQREFEKARQILQSNKELFQSGLMLKQVRSDVRKWQDIREKLAGETRLDDARKKELVDKVNEEINKRLQIFERL